MARSCSARKKKKATTTAATRRIITRSFHKKQMSQICCRSSSSTATAAAAATATTTTLASGNSNDDQKFSTPSKPPPPLPPPPPTTTTSSTSARNYDYEHGGFSTPKADKNKIPQISACPPAPKKTRQPLMSNDRDVLSSNCSRRTTSSPVPFFSHPDLEHFFFLALHQDHVKV